MLDLSMSSPQTPSTLPVQVNRAADWLTPMLEITPIIPIQPTISLSSDLQFDLSIHESMHYCSNNVDEEELAQLENLCELSKKEANGIVTATLEDGKINMKNGTINQQNGEITATEENKTEIKNIDEFDSTVGGYKPTQYEDSPNSKRFKSEKRVKTVHGPQALMPAIDAQQFVAKIILARSTRDFVKVWKIRNSINKYKSLKAFK